MPASPWRRRGSILFPVLMSLLLVSFFFPLSAKTSNNIFYAGLGLPAVVWWLRAPRDCLRPFLASPVFFVFFALLALALGVKDGAFLKDASYVLALYLACVMIESKGAVMERVFLAFSLASIVVLGAAAVEWATQLQSSGTGPRVALWGQSENPIFAALMIISAMAFVWLFHAEERLAARSRTAHWGGFLALIGFCVMCAIVFQARSALLGFGLFALGYALDRRYWKATAIALVPVVGFFLLSGWGELLLERGLSFRPAIWVAAVDRVIEQCGILTGCGKDRHRFLGEFYHAHSAYVSVLYYGGLTGLALFAGMSVAFFVQTWRARSRWLLVALVGWGGLLTTTNGVIASPRPLWVFFWIPTFMALIESGRPALEAYYRAREGISRGG